MITRGQRWYPRFYLCYDDGLTFSFRSERERKFEEERFADRERQRIAWYATWAWRNKWPTYVKGPDDHELVNAAKRLGKGKHAISYVTLPDGTRRIISG